MESFQFVAGQLLVQLPVLAVLLTSFIVVSTRRRAIGGRRATLAIAALAVLAVDVALSTVWTLAVPTLMARGNLEVTQLGVLSSVFGFLLAAMMATGIGLLVAAVVAPSAQPAAPPSYFPPQQ